MLYKGFLCPVPSFRQVHRVHLLIIGLTGKANYNLRKSKIKLYNK